jgi:hypothetical protein
MRAVPLAKTLGVGSFAGLQAAVGISPNQISNAFGGFSGSGFKVSVLYFTEFW